VNKNIYNMTLIIIGAIISAVGINIFLIPHKMLSGGISGISMIVGYFTPLNISLVYFALNLPLLICGWFLIGRRFVIYSAVSVIVTTLFLSAVPIIVVTNDPLLSALYAGILFGVGSGISFKAGGSGGGFDVLGAIISKFRDLPIGSIIICLNAIVIMSAGYITGNWNIALASAVCVYVAGKVLNFIHTEHEKVTAYIITDHIEEMTQALFQLHRRGITRIESVGAYSGEDKNMLMTVITRYELVEVKDAIRRVDPNAFVNITQTLEVIGNFRKRSAYR
jgi:uncharacterized membrane-anchored protein YitT (DUF2179 family)